ncbi:hypothetical protein PAXRUDRAFT_175310 [Paxillus rubicundulus Ve08.2h10]|uniref:Uncharacterized protein n=1 Tax=Paxillus rubicundulus Ve08.2h10 TaxID=930991 RepID=A0A0D0BT19_9AGAM|nr:hypothetical protein PAXRUDRAFT_175310 [Paxillus rubicundulus Ve08.2h10]
MSSSANALSWVVTHGKAAVFLLQHILLWHSCWGIGEKCRIYHCGTECRGQIPLIRIEGT